MKKFLPLFLCVFCLAKPWAGSLSWDFSTKNSISTVEAVLDSETIKYRLKIKQNGNGLFTVEMPPSFSIDYGKVKLGEIKIVDNILCNTDTPSLSPGFTGLAYRTGNLALAAFTPSFGPESPSGGFVSYSFENLEISLLYTYPNRYNTTNSVNSYQKDWSNISSAGRTLKTKLNVKSSVSSTTVYYISNQFNGRTVTCDTDIFLYFLSASLKLGRNKVSEISLAIPGTVETELSYYSEKGKKPIYGGTAQEADISFRIKATYKDYFFSALSRNIFDEDTGHRSISSFSLGALKSDFSCDLTLQNTRTKGTEKKFFISNADFENDKLKISFSNGKTKLVFTEALEFEGQKINISIDQDKEITVSGKFSY